MITQKISYTDNYKLPLYNPGARANLIALNAGFIEIDTAIKDALDSANNAAGTAANNTQRISDTLDVLKTQSGLIAELTNNTEILAGKLDDTADALRETNIDLGEIKQTATTADAKVDDLTLDVDKLKWQDLPTVSLVPPDWVDAVISARYKSGDSVRVHVASSAASIKAGKSNLAVVDIPGNIAYGNTVVSVHGMLMGVVRAESDNVVSIEVAEDYSGSIDIYINIWIKEG